MPWCTVMDLIVCCGGLLCWFFGFCSYPEVPFSRKQKAQQETKLVEKQPKEKWWVRLNNCFQYFWLRKKSLFFFFLGCIIDVTHKKLKKATFRLLSRFLLHDKKTIQIIIQSYSYNTYSSIQYACSPIVRLVKKIKKTRLSYNKLKQGGLH